MVSITTFCGHAHASPVCLTTKKGGFAETFTTVRALLTQKVYGKCLSICDIELSSFIIRLDRSRDEKRELEET
jgi:hypothetical protein